MKLLFIHFGNKESFFFLSSCFVTLKQKYSDCSISLLLEKGMENFSSNFDHIDSIFYAENSFFDRRKLIKTLNAESFDYLIDLQRDFFKSSYYFAKKIKAKDKIGYNYPNKAKPFTIPIQKKRQAHIHDYYMIGLEHFKIEKKFSPSLKLDSKMADVKNDFRKYHLGKNPILFLSKQASFSDEKWQDEKWNSLLKNHNLKLFDVIIDSTEFSSDELEQFSKESYLFPLNLAKKENRIYVIQQCRFLISLSSFDFLIAQQESKSSLLLDSNNKQRKLLQPLSKGSYVVTARFSLETVENIQLDSVIKAFRQMLTD